MWIGSPPHLIDRRRLVSPLGYQSPALGDSVPAPGLQDTHRMTPQLGVTTSTLSRVPRLFASAVSQARTRREVESEPRISQTWAEPTCQCNQAHVHFKKYDVIHMPIATFLPFRPFSPLGAQQTAQTHFLTSS